jgi:hypothetical protein
MSRKGAKAEIRPELLMTVQAPERGIRPIKAIVRTVTAFTKIRQCTWVVSIPGRRDQRPTAGASYLADGLPISAFGGRVRNEVHQQDTGSIPNRFPDLRSFSSVSRRTSAERGVTARALRNDARLGPNPARAATLTCDEICPSMISRAAGSSAAFAPTESSCHRRAIPQSGRGCTRRILSGEEGVQRSAATPGLDVCSQH